MGQLVVNAREFTELLKKLRKKVCDMADRAKGRRPLQGAICAGAEDVILNTLFVDSPGVTGGRGPSASEARAARDRRTRGTDPRTGRPTSERGVIAGPGGRVQGGQSGSIGPFVELLFIVRRCKERGRR